MKKFIILLYVLEFSCVESLAYSQKAKKRVNEMVVACRAKDIKVLFAKLSTDDQFRRSVKIRAHNNCSKTIVAVEVGIGRTANELLMIHKRVKIKILPYATTNISVSIEEGHAVYTPMATSDIHFIRVVYSDGTTA
ncbi:hypothetical protein [Spirosoma utsteinense]|uniref:Uncharacterized protein n=1 Tax=Spirosoma utsteinense TaxID=2585773 RepID=A0ABR6WB59_9BACT|nr:hypothetical protein [Spirosoma utsteinense]MBC3786486.1 hypothetical protein [Spirosoma utsteinense]MBC3793801.1 hypothetical protein [Spirosoma utsteinense]